MKGVDAKGSRTPWFSPLHKATIKGDLDEVKRLIKDGSNPLDPDMKDNTLLHHAAAIGELKILRNVTATQLKEAGMVIQLCIQQL